MPRTDLELIYERLNGVAERDDVAEFTIGTTVDLARCRAALHADDVISLATGYLHSSLMPLAALRSALARAARLPDAWERPPAAGLHGLRSWFAEQAGAGADAQDVLITSGGQGAPSSTKSPAASPGTSSSTKMPRSCATRRAGPSRRPTSSPTASAPTVSPVRC